MPPIPSKGPGSAKAKAVASKFKASGPGRPAPIKKQPLPAYGPYKLPLTDTEKRIVINKRTPKFVNTPRGRIATGGGGVGFFTKGDKTPIMARVAQRALARQGGIEESAATRLSAERDTPKPVSRVSEEASVRPTDSALLGFYDQYVLPSMGRAFADFTQTTRETSGLNLLSPQVAAQSYFAKGLDTAAEAVGVKTTAEENVYSQFDETAASPYLKAVKDGAYGLALTRGWDTAKPYVVPAVDKAAKIVKDSGAAASNAVSDSADWTDKSLTGNVVYDWSKKNAAVPAKDFVADAYEYLFNPGLTKRIDSLSPRDREKLYASHDMENRNPNVVSSAYTTKERDQLIRLASGQANDNSLWADYDSGFTVEELSKMSDFELINAATGAHSNVMQRVWNAAKNDFKKIGAMAAGVQQLGDIIEESEKKGDYRGLGYMAEYFAKQAGYNVWALHQAGLYAGTAGLGGDYKPLVRALQAEPILTTLDVVATASGYGKAGTAALKTGGLASKIGAAGSRVPGAARAGSRIATAAERAAYRMEGAASGIGPEARVPTTLGGPLRAAAAVGRGARRIADTEVVVANSPVSTRLRETTQGVEPGSAQGTVYLPGSSFFSKGRAVLSKKAYEQDNAVGAVIRDVSRKMDAARERALISHVANVMGSQRAQVYVKAFQRLIKQDPIVAQRAMFDLQGLDVLDLPKSIAGALGGAAEGGRLVIGPAEELARLQRVLDGELWVRRGAKDSPDEFRYTTEDISDTGFKQVLTPAEAQKRGITDLSLYERLTTDETKNLVGNADSLLRIANVDEAKVTQAKEFLSVAIEGARRGRGEPPSSIEGFATADELANIEALSKLGKTGNRGVEDLPGGLGSQLGIPEATGPSRRQRAMPATEDAAATEDLSLLARLQDPTVARLQASPLAGVLRTKIEEILAGKEASRLEPKVLAEAQNKIDAYVESALRDLIEAGDIPSGGRAFFPTEKSAKGAKMDYDPTKSLAGRASRRDLLDVHTAQIALVGSADEIAKFGSVLAQNLRLPMMAFQIVTRLNAYLMRTGVVIKMAETEAGFAKQLDSIVELQQLYNGTRDDFRVIVVDEKTGFLGDRLLNDLQTESLDKIGSRGVEGIQIGEARISEIINEAISADALEAFDFKTMQGKRVVIVETNRLKKLNKEIAQAAQAPGYLERLSRAWVRVTLNTLPRTAFTNIMGSAVLAALGGTRFRGFADAFKLMQSGDIPPEISRVGMAGLVDTPFAARLGDGGLWASTGQRYMDTLRMGNVMGEDFSRMAVFVGSVRKSLKSDPALVAKLERELAEAGKVNAAFEDLLAFVARGEYGKGRLVSPEAFAVRDKAIASATDFLGTQAGLTSKTRNITKVIPFYHWYAHIIKLYFWTMPLNYPGRTIFLNTLSRISEDQQRESGLMDSYYSDAVRVGTQMVGDNEYAVGLRSGLLPFSGFGGIGAGESSAPLVEYVFASTTPLITTPAVLAGLTGDFRPMLSANGERIPNVLAPGGFEAAAAQLERIIAPLGLFQRTLSPSGSLFASAARGFPEVEQKRPGDDYAITPRGIPGLGGLRGAAEATLGGLTGLSIVRTPVGSGPVKRRQTKGREKSKMQEFKDNKKKEREANKK